jgi:phasin family protein
MKNNLFPFDVPTLMDSVRGNMQAWAQAQQWSLESLQMLAHQQGTLLSTLQRGQAAWFQTLAHPDRPQDKLGDQALILKDLYDRLYAQLNEIQDLTHQSRRETSALLQKRLGQTLADMKHALDRAETRRVA